MIIVYTSLYNHTTGVAGSIFIVVPNLMGICVWSPPLDSLGNSYRGIEFAKMLCQRFSFHQVHFAKYLYRFYVPVINDSLSSTTVLTHLH